MLGQQSFLFPVMFTFLPLPCFLSLAFPLRTFLAQFLFLCLKSAPGRKSDR